MKTEHSFSQVTRHVAQVVCICCCVLILNACTLQSAGMSTDEHAAENRQYMALLNQKSSDLKSVLEDFQSAVAAGDVVRIKACTTKAGKIIDEVKSSKATESLASVKEVYVGGLEAINTAMNDYTNLYSDVAAGRVSQGAFDRRLKAVQVSYDSAVEKLTAADEELTKLANE